MDEFFSSGGRKSSAHLLNSGYHFCSNHAVSFPSLSGQMVLWYSGHFMVSRLRHNRDVFSEGAEQNAYQAASLAVYFRLF